MNEDLINTVVLKCWDGTKKVYEGVEAVALADNDGEKHVYSRGEVLEGASVSVSFENGDMTLSAPSGFLIRSAVVKKPEALLPENILEGVNIAGVVGSRALVPDGYVTPSGDIEITKNGTHDVSGRARAVVNVPVPAGYYPVTVCTQAEYDELLASDSVGEDTVYLITEG